MTDEEIIKLRQLGYSLQYIGKSGGISRQAVSERLKRYPNIKPLLVWEREAARTIGCPVDYLVKLRERGLTILGKAGIHWVYSPEDIRRVQLSMQRTCPHCGVQFALSSQRKYCPECSTKRGSHPYSFYKKARKNPETRTLT